MRYTELFFLTGVHHQASLRVAAATVNLPITILMLSLVKTPVSEVQYGDCSPPAPCPLADMLIRYR